MIADLIIANIQSDLYWEDKEKNLAHFTKQIQSIDSAVDLILLPEMFNTGFSMNSESLSETMDGYTVAWMRAQAIQFKCAIMGSLIVEEEGKYYNRLIHIDQFGKIEKYDKKHLFSLAGEDKYFEPGHDLLTIEIKGWKIRPFVCYDLRFPVWLRNSFSKDNSYDYDVMVVLANWPQKRSKAWLSLLQARAIENQCYVVGTNRVGIDKNELVYSGDSSLFDALGECIYSYKQDEKVIISRLSLASLLEIRKSLPFLKDADSFSILDK